MFLFSCVSELHLQFFLYMSNLNCCDRFPVYPKWFLTPRLNKLYTLSLSVALSLLLFIESRFMFLTCICMNRTGANTITLVHSLLRDSNFPNPETFIRLQITSAAVERPDRFLQQRQRSLIAKCIFINLFSYSR